MGFHLWSDVFYQADKSARQDIVRATLEDLYEYEDLYNDLKNQNDMFFVGVSRGTWFVPTTKAKKTKQIALSSPGLIYHSKDLPLTFIVAPTMKDDLKSITNNMPETDKIYKWVKTVLKSSDDFKKKLKNEIFRGIEVYDAQFKDMGPNNEPRTLEEKLMGPTKWKVEKKRPECVELVKRLKDSKDFKWLGFAPVKQYYKVRGSEDEIAPLWDHPFGSPALLYAHKYMPILIIAGPDIKFNDSMSRSIKSNKWLSDVYGFAG